MAHRRTNWRGLSIVIENDAGSYREWKRPDGSPGRTLMRHPYGFFADHAGSDGDELDCYIGPDMSARFVYVVHQLMPDGKRDEDKCFLDFRDEAAAKTAFLAHRDDGERAYGGMSSIPADTFIAKLSRRSGDGKIRHSRMPQLFSIPAFRFSLDGAIGRWSRIASMGTKAKDGARMTFNAETLGEMVVNAEARGDKIAINADHASAYPETREAPALGFFGALAVVEGGKVVKAWGGEPDVTGIDDGLYGRLDEITPRGADPLVGLGNFKFTSPMFTTEGEAEDGTAIGFSLFDVAATNTPFQSGCEIQMHRSSTPALEMARGSLTVRQRNGRWEVLSELDDGSLYPVDSFGTEEEAHAEIRKRGAPFKDAGRPAGKAQRVNGYSAPAAQAITMAWTPDGIEVGDTVRVDNGDGDVSECRVVHKTGGGIGVKDLRTGRASYMTPSTNVRATVTKLSGASRRNGVQTMAAYFAPGQRVENRQSGDRGTVLEMKPNRHGINVVWVEYDDGETHDVRPENLKAMSITPGAARRFSQGAPMDETQMAQKFGFEPDDDAEKKMAKVMAYAADLEAKMGEHAEPDGDEKKAVEEFAAEVGVDKGEKTMSRALVAFRAKFAPQTEIATLKSQVHALSQSIAARDKAAADAQLAAFADAAINDGRWDKDKRAQLVAFARADMKAATESLSPRGTYTLLGRVATGLSEQRRPAVSAEGKRGVAFSQKVKERIERTKERFDVAAAHVAREFPDLAREASGEA